SNTGTTLGCPTVHLTPGVFGYNQYCPRLGLGKSHSVAVCGIPVCEPLSSIADNVLVNDATLIATSGNGLGWSYLGISYITYSEPSCTRIFCPGIATGSQTDLDTRVKVPEPTATIFGGAAG